MAATFGCCSSSEIIKAVYILHHGLLNQSYSHKPSVWDFACKTLNDHIKLTALGVK